MMSTPDSLAARLYGQPAPAGPSAPAMPVADPALQPPAARAQGVAQTPGDLSEALYSGEGAGVNASTYDGAALGSAFDSLEHEARSEGDTDTAEALREGRREAAALLAELQVPTHEAKTIAIALAEVARSPQSPEALEVHRERAATTLRAEWGDRYDSELRVARAAYAHASRRLPWLAELIEAGAGNNPAVIRAFAGMGRRLQGPGR